MVPPVYCRLSTSASSDIASIEALCNRPPWPVELFKSEFDHSYSYTYGARANGKLIGFLILHAVLDEIHILNFGVHPDSRGKGVGKGLLRHILCSVNEERGSAWATLEVRKSNLIAQKLYQSFGFNEVAIRQRYYTDDQEDAYVLRLHVPTYLAEDKREYA